MSTTIYSITASRAIRTSSAVECHQEPFSFPSGFSESPTPASAEGASFRDPGSLKIWLRKSIYKGLQSTSKSFFKLHKKLDMSQLAVSMGIHELGIFLCPRQNSNGPTTYQYFDNFFTKKLLIILLKHQFSTKLTRQQKASLLSTYSIAFRRNHDCLHYINKGRVMAQ